MYAEPEPREVQQKKAPSLSGCLPSKVMFILTRSAQVSSHSKEKLISNTSLLSHENVIYSVWRFSFEIKENILFHNLSRWLSFYSFNNQVNPVDFLPIEILSLIKALIKVN